MVSRGFGERPWRTEVRTHAKGLRRVPMVVPSAVGNPIVEPVEIHRRQRSRARISACRCEDEDATHRVYPVLCNFLVRAGDANWTSYT